MNLAGQIALTAARLMQHRAGPFAERALELAQRGAERAAEHVEDAGPRIATLAEAGRKLGEITSAAWTSSFGRASRARKAHSMTVPSDCA